MMSISFFRAKWDRYLSRGQTRYNTLLVRVVIIGALRVPMGAQRPILVTCCFFYFSVVAVESPIPGKITSDLLQMVYLVELADFF